MIITGDIFSHASHWLIRNAIQGSGFDVTEVITRDGIGPEGIAEEFADTVGLKRRRVKMRPDLYPKDPERLRDCATMNYADAMIQFHDGPHPRDRQAALREGMARRNKPVLTVRV